MTFLCLEVALILESINVFQYNTFRILKLFVILGTFVGIISTTVIL